MKTIRGINLPINLKTALISLRALSLSAWLVVSLYHTVPVPRVSASAQYGAISGLVTDPNLAGLDSEKGESKEICPLLLTCKSRRF